MITLIRNKLISPEQIARNPRKVKGGWIFTHPPKDLWRYNKHARKQAIKEWATYGAAALASIVGGYPMPPMGTLVSDGDWLIPNEILKFGAQPGLTTETIDAAGEYVGMVFRVPKTGSIRSFGLLVATATGSPTADFQFETVDATTGLPTGTLWGTNTSKTGVAVTSGWFEPGDFTADASVIIRDVVAAVCRYASGTSIGVSRINNNLVGGGAYRVLNQGTPGTATRAVCIAVKYSDGTYGRIPNTFPSSSSSFITSFSSSSNPNHRGNVYTNPTPKRCIGGWAQWNLAGDVDFIVATDSWDGTADNDGTSNLVVSLDSDLYPGSAILQYVLFDSSLNFDAGADYRVIYKPGGTAVVVYHMDVSVAAIMNQMEIGSILIETTANNPTGAGSWTDTPTRRSFSGFWFDQFDDGVSSGGGLITHPGMSGGMRG